MSSALALREKGSEMTAYYVGEREKVGQIGITVRCRLSADRYGDQCEY